MKFVLLVCAMHITNLIYAQHSLTLAVKSAAEKIPLAGATVTIKELNKTATTDSLGNVLFNNLAAGSYTLNISFTEMKEQELKTTVPAPSTTIEIFLEPEEDEEDEVIVTATRTSRSIRDIPTRVETISGEELSEKANMKPGDIRMMLSESTGIQTQQTSATSYSSGIRIQGLDGRYTQLLKDGFPMYSGFSGGLSLLQIAPLDLRQVEIIKGSSSTLYGGGAIAGLVNLVSKTPREKRELSFLVNGTSAKGLDLSGFYSQCFKKMGITVFGSRNSGSPFDPSDIGLTAIPKFERYTINPRLFFYGKKITADIGVSYITEDRIGGSMRYIKDDIPGYFEKNNTDRWTTQFSARYSAGTKTSVNLKSSFSSFDRLISIPSYIFEAKQLSSYSELNIVSGSDKFSWIAGLNFSSEQLTEEKRNNNIPRNYLYNTLGVFVQNTWSPVKKFALETGIRVDHVNDYGFEFLPRLSALFRPTDKLAARLGAGLGYKTPTIFTEEAERMQFQNILPIDPHSTVNERSTGVNFDINYRLSAGELGITINQLFFYTWVNKPLQLVTNSGGTPMFINASGHLDTKGTETNLRFTFHDFKLFVGYTLADVKTHFNNTKKDIPLNARHRLNNVLMYEKEDNIKIGLEAYYFSKQKLSDGDTGRSYWICGLMAEKFWEKFSVFINFENFTDTRQARYGDIYTGSIDNPVFKDIYAPVDGFVVNGGIKLRF